MSWEVFDNHAKEYDEWFDRNRAAYLSEVEVLRKVLPEAGRGLEIGVGTGRFAAPLGVYVGVDPSMNMAKVAMARGIRVVLGCGESLPFRDREFDWVLLSTTLCFVAVPERTLKEAKRTIRKNGKIIVGIIDGVSPLGRFYRRRQGSFYKHAHFHSTEEVIGMLGAFRFRNFQMYQTIFHHPNGISETQEAREGYGEGGFVVASGEKR